MHLVAVGRWSLGGRHVLFVLTAEHVQLNNSFFLERNTHAHTKEMKWGSNTKAGSASSS